MEEMSNRHEGDIDGKLPTFASRQSVTVRIVVDPSVAAYPSAQHTAWMAVNLLARTDGIIDAILIDCPSTPVHDRVVPFGSARELDARLVEAANLIYKPLAHPAGSTAADRTIRISSHRRADDDILAVGGGWWGGISISGAPIDLARVDVKSAIPFGPYLAATFAVGDIYLRARGLPAAGVIAYGWDSWNQTPALAPVHGPKPAVDLSQVALAGVGAVGAAWMHAIWAYTLASGSVAVVDADRNGIDLTNLNRGALFTLADLGKPKADVAAEAITGGPRWIPINGRYEESGVRPDVLVSAVDTNAARDAIQFTYPARALGGSTHDLRAEIVHVGTPGVGACLRCYNEPEAKTPDEEIRRRAFVTAGAIAEVGKELDLEAELVESTLRSNACGQLSDRMMLRLRAMLEDPSLPRFSVGFVSVAAGVLLAAETIKLLSNPGGLFDASQSVRIQYLNPHVGRGGRAQLRDSACPKCSPTTAAFKVWSNRHSAFHRTTAQRDR